MSKDGWWWPANARKAHYMIAGRSLCGEWGCLGNAHPEQGNDDSPDNCAECKRRLKQWKGGAG